MNRRGALAALLAVGGTPFAAWPQSVPNVPQIAVLSLGTSAASTERWTPLSEAFRKLGYEEGRNIRVERFFLDGHVARLAAAAAAIAAGDFAVVVTTGDREVMALRSAAVVAPIVFTFVPDPLERGFVANLARPGGNITGFSTLAIGLGQKWTEVLAQIAPEAKRVAIVASPANTRTAFMREFGTAARALGMTATAVNPAGNPVDFASALLQAKREGTQGIIVPMDGESFRHRHVLARSALELGLPGVFGDAGFVEAGGLVSYSPRFADRLHGAAGYVDRILRGARPGELPVQQPTRFELVVNLRTAKALGIVIPKPLLLRADRVIE